MMLDFSSVPQSILLRLQSKETTKKVRQRKPPNFQTQQGQNDETVPFPNTR